MERVAPILEHAAAPRPADAAVPARGPARHRHERRAAMTLRRPPARARPSPPGLAAAQPSRASRRTAAPCSPGFVFFAVPGTQGRRARLRAAGRRTRRQRPSSAERPPADLPTTCSASSVPDVRGRAGRGRGAVLSGASPRRSSPSRAPAARPRSPRSCGRSGRALGRRGGLARHARPRGARRRDLWRR